MVATSPPSGSPRQRAILLGASNLTRAFATVLDVAERVLGEPLDVLAALGHGRSYGARSTVLVRSLPATLSCGLWPALDERERVPTAALVTDIGNDLLYETPVDQIIVWLTRCLDLLERYDARVVVTRLPVDNIEHVPEWKFRLLRRLFFPLGRLPLATIAQRARELDARLAELTAARGVTTVAQSWAWYGWDPIHLKSSQWPTAWHQILSGWSERPTPSPAANAPLSRAIYLRTRAPEQRWWLGISQRGNQPCARLPSGTQVSIY